MPLAITLTSTLVSVNGDGVSSKIIISPTLSDIRQANSIHVLAFTSHHELLMVESEGSFTMDEWYAVFKTAQDVCCGIDETADSDVMVDEDLEENEENMTRFLRSTLQEKVASELQWRG